jgi:Glycosyltransferase Family 4
VTAEPPPTGAPLPGAVRVASIPSHGPYVDAVLPWDAVHVGPHSSPSPWLDAAYLAEHGAEIDVLHLHTGDPHVAEMAGQCWTETARRLGLPLVVTVHDLRPATAAGNGVVDAHLEAVLANAEVVLTLTSGAADEIAERYGRTAIVVSHPSVAAPDPDLGAERGLVGLCLDATAGDIGDQASLVRGALSGAVSGGGRLRVLVDARDESALDPSVRELADRGELELVVHPRGNRAAQLQQLHVAVLPERRGTHSRNLEICRDVGTGVVAPGGGWFADQWSEVVSYGSHADGSADPMSLSAAVSAALTRPMPRPADRVWRAEQRAAVQRVHAEIYAQVASDRVWA